MNIQWISRIAMVAWLAGAFGFAAGDTRAQSYPSKPIAYIVPYGPGSGVDVVARIVATKVSQSWGHSVVVENRPGASGNVGMELAAKAAADGYTIVIASASEIINQFVFKARYDILRDFTPVTLTGSGPLVLAVTQSLPTNSVAELVALAKAKPGQLHYAAVKGSNSHLVAEMLRSARGINIELVSYKSSTDAVSDVVSGRVEMMFTTMATALPLVNSGKMRVLAVTGDKRAGVLPNVPTLTELGLSTVDVGVGFFILAPAGTPAPIIGALNREFVKALGTKEVTDRLASAAAVESKSSSPEALAAMLKNEVPRWSKIVKDAGIIRE